MSEEGSPAYFLEKSKKYTYPASLWDHFMLRSTNSLNDNIAWLMDFKIRKIKGICKEKNYYVS